MSTVPGFVAAALDYQWVSWLEASFTFWGLKIDPRHSRVFPANVSSLLQFRSAEAKQIMEDLDWFKVNISEKEESIKVRNKIPKRKYSRQTTRKKNPAITTFRLSLNCWANSYCATMNKNRPSRMGLGGLLVKISIYIFSSSVCLSVYLSVFLSVCVHPSLFYRQKLVIAILPRILS